MALSLRSNWGYGGKMFPLLLRDRCRIPSPLPPTSVKPYAQPTAQTQIIQSWPNVRYKDGESGTRSSGSNCITKLASFFCGDSRWSREILNTRASDYLNNAAIGSNG